MEIWTKISLQLPSALGWAGTGPANIPGLAQKHQCPSREQSAFSGMRQPLRTSPGGSGKGTGPPLKSWVTARKQDTEDDQDRTPESPKSL